MPAQELSRWAVEALTLVVCWSAPILIASFCAAVLVGVVQSATQMHDATLSFVPKLAVTIGALVLLGGAMGREVLRFTVALWQKLPVLFR